MIFLFVGMIASGISARIALLSYRGGWLLEDQVRKSSGVTIFELVGSVAGISAFIISFLLFDWWWPLIAFFVGYWLLAPFVITRASFAFFYQIQLVITLIAFACSLAIFEIYFDLL